MKNLLITYVLLCLLTSCTSDSDSNPIEVNNVSNEKLGNAQIGPENKLNPFDKKGALYYGALADYQSKNQVPNSIKEITEQIRYISSKIGKKNITQKGIIVFNDSIVESIMSDPDNCMINIVQNSQLASNTKSTLINFLQGVINHRQLDFAITYEYIVNFEETITDDTSFDDEEAETILTITSISRYSLYSETERKDKDWDLSAGNKPARKFFASNETSIISIIALLKSIL